jgi:hypothetical protein
VGNEEMFDPMRILRRPVVVWYIIGRNLFEVWKVSEDDRHSDR